jgi:hypothetical protein
MAAAPMATLRIRSHWFKDGAARSPAEHASAVAFIVWRVARNMLARMRRAQFDIDAGPAYFAFMREVLVFLIQVADRTAFRRMDSAARVEFTTALVRRVAATLQENEDDLLGAPAPGEPSHADRFVDLVNELAGHYAEFGADPTSIDFVPDFAFMRYLGARITPHVPPKDGPWVLDQVIGVEAPEAVAIVQRGMRDLFSSEPRTARRPAESGD